MLLDADLAVLLAEFLESEGGLAYPGHGGLVASLVDVGLDGGDLRLDVLDDLFHNDTIYLIVDWLVYQSLHITANIINYI